MKFLLIVKTLIYNLYVPFSSSRHGPRQWSARRRVGGGLQMLLSYRSQIDGSIIFDPGPSDGNDGSGLPSTRHSRNRLCCGKMWEANDLMEVRAWHFDCQAPTFLDWPRAWLWLAVDVRRLDLSFSVIHHEVNSEARVRFGTGKRHGMVWYGMVWHDRSRIPVVSLPALESLDMALFLKPFPGQISATRIFVRLDQPGPRCSYPPILQCSCATAVPPLKTWKVYEVRGSPDNPPQHIRFSKALGKTW